MMRETGATFRSEHSLISPNERWRLFTACQVRQEGAAGTAPAVVMAHGFSAVKEMYLDKFAEVFAMSRSS
jgi:hypothetical protein